MGRIAVSDFREMAQAGIVEMGPEGFDESQAGLLVRFARIPTNADPSLNKRARQPRPDGPLMIGRIPLSNRADIMAAIGGRSRLERAQAQRRPKQGFHKIDNLACRLFLQDRPRQPADGEDLIRSYRVVDRTPAMIDIDHIEQATSRLVPKSRLKRSETSLVNAAPARIERSADPQGRKPESFHLHRFANPRGDGPTIDACIHPGQGDAVGSRGKKSIVVAADSIARPAIESGEDVLHGLPQGGLHSREQGT